jgi:hypothetical protein
MTAEATETKRRFPWLAVLGVIAIAATLVLPIAAGGGGAPACAAPPPGPRQWQPVRPYWVYLQIFGPALLTFFIGGYLALGARRSGVRLAAFLAVLIVTGMTTLIAMAFAPFTCGSLFPW